MQDMKKVIRERENKVDERTGLGFKIGVRLGVVVLCLFGVAMVAKVAADWGAGHQIVSQQVVDLKIQFPFRIEDRKPVEIISPLAKEIIETKEALSPIEEKVVSLWGQRYGYIALAIFRCESGLRADAVNWTSRDIGIAQINWPIWENPVKEKFGYTLIDMFDEDKNLEVAYWIWDRADGKEGDGTGSFEPWVVFTNGSFRGCIN